MNRFLLLLLTLLGPLLAGAQTGLPFGLTYQGDLAKVVHGTETLRNAWAGGLNSPQFSALDLNGDQQPDLYLFDRFTNRSLTFLNVAAPGGGRTYQYAPEYEVLFPADLRGWALLRDYDCDNRPDLFTLNGGDIRVFRNVAGAGGRPDFQLVASQLFYANNSTSRGNINTGGYNIPAIQDVNGDGLLDILTFDFVNSATVELYLNSGATGCGNLGFRLESLYWGGISSCFASCTSYSFNALCRTLRPAHTGGHSITLLDVDADGDQDALVGRDYCAQLLQLTNEGTRDVARMTSAGLRSDFPAGTAPVRVPNFPTAYSVDVTFDGRPDLVVTPSLFDNQDSVNLRQAVALYENTSTGAAPAFTYRQADFLQHEMLDAGDGAAPTFADVDGDGLTDMLVGSTNRSGAKGFYRASLAYYRNTGTATQPVLQLITNDYLGFSSARNYTGAQPVLADLNKDGVLELVLSVQFLQANGISTNRLLLVPNKATAGQPAAFDLAAAQELQNMPNFPGDAPCFTDLDGDGRLDLLLGTSVNDITGPGLRYYRNTGTLPLNQAFTLVDADYGHLRTAAGDQIGNLRPAVADFDGNGQPDLLTTDAKGQVRFFANFRTQSAPFPELAQVFYNYTLGSYQPLRLGQGAANLLAPAATDLNGDQRPELFLGLESGGMLVYGARSQVLATTPSSALPATALRVYPNPTTTTTTATVEAAAPVRLTLLDVTGRILFRGATAARSHQLDLRGLAPGIYVVQAVTEQGQRAVQRLVVQ